MYIETSSPRVSGDNAKIEKSGLQFTGSTCIRFFFHMYGATIGTLNVFIAGSNVFQMTGPQGNMWKEAIIKVSQVGTHSVSVHLFFYFKFSGQKSRKCEVSALLRDLINSWF